MMKKIYSEIIQVEVEISECNHVSFDGGITYQRAAIIPIKKLDIYAPEKDIELKLNCMA